MKKSLIILSTFIIGVTPLLASAQYANDSEFVTALKWMHSQGLTKYNTVDEFRASDSLTRQEAAKFFASVLSFATLPAQNAVTNFACSFEDSDEFDQTLAQSIQLACEAGLMKGYDNKFHPNDLLSKAEALTVLIRMQSGQLAEDQTPRWKNYYDQAFQTKLTKETDESKIELPITRYEAALLLNRQYGVPSLPIDDGGSEVEDNTKEFLDFVQKQEVKDTLRSNYLRTE